MSIQKKDFPELMGTVSRQKASIEPGKLADLVVKAEDPFKTEPLSLHKVAVERTMVGGPWVYES